MDFRPLADVHALLLSHRALSRAWSPALATVLRLVVVGAVLGGSTHRWSWPRRRSWFRRQDGRGLAQRRILGNGRSYADKRRIGCADTCRRGCEPLPPQPPELPQVVAVVPAELLPPRRSEPPVSVETTCVGRAACFSRSPPMPVEPAAPVEPPPPVPDHRSVHAGIGGRAPASATVRTLAGAARGAGRPRPARRPRWPRAASQPAARNRSKAERPPSGLAPTLGVSERSHLVHGESNCMPFVAGASLHFGTRGRSRHCRSGYGPLLWRTARPRPRNTPRGIELV